jgi:hypothetical protein
MNRSEEIRKLRQAIKTIKQNLESSMEEQFQNDSIRPILKFQHTLLLALFHSCLAKNKIAFIELKQEEQEAKLDQLFQKELAFKNQSIGAVIGLLTTEEYNVYASDISAFNKRILTMLKQRIMSVY